MKITFKRKKSFYGMANKMKVFINGELVTKLKNGEVFEYDGDVTSIKIGGTMVKSLNIPVFEKVEDIEIVISFQAGLLVSGFFAKVYTNGHEIGTYKASM